MNHFPITNKDGSKDKRYSVAMEYCGYANRYFVLRFCGDFIDSFIDYPSAVLRAVGHKAVLNGAAIITEKRDAI